MEERDRKRVMTNELRAFNNPDENATPEKADTHFLSKGSPFVTAPTDNDIERSPMKMNDLETKLKPEDLQQIAEYKSKLRKRQPNYEPERYDFDYEPFGKALKPGPYSIFFPKLNFRAKSPPNEVQRTRRTDRDVLASTWLRGYA
jgi:hypothetical protein